MIPYILFAAAGLLLSACTQEKNEAARPPKTQSANSRPTPPPKPSHAAPRIKDPFAEDSVGEGSVGKDSYIEDPFADYPIPNAKESDEADYKKFLSLTEAEKNFRGVLGNCYAPGDPANFKDPQNFDDKYVRCLKEAFKKYPDIYSLGSVGEQYWAMHSLAWENIKAFRHYNDQVAFDRMMVYGLALGVQKSQLNEIEDKLKKAHQENLDLQKKYCFRENETTEGEIPDSREIICPEPKVNTLEVIQIVGEVPK